MRELTQPLELWSLGWIALAAISMLGCQQVDSQRKPSAIQSETKPGVLADPAMSDPTPIVGSVELTANDTDQPESRIGISPSNLDETTVQQNEGLEERMLFFPTKYPTGNWEPAGLDYEDVWITSPDETRIHGWYCDCENPRAYLLFAHGNAGNLSDRAALVTCLQRQLNVCVLMIDYRGYGRSEGRPTVAGAIQDVHAGAEFLASRAGIDPGELVLMGRSLGGALVVAVAADLQPRALILESTFGSLKQIAKHHYPQLAWLVPRKKLDSISAIASYHGRLLQSHGTVDRTIPMSLAAELFAAANEPKQWVELQGADHNDAASARYYTIIDEFLDSHLPNK